MKLVAAVDRHFAHSGLAGVAFVLTGFLVPQFAFIGQSGEFYSMLSHFISELGWIGVSRLAIIFNLGLILGGLCFAIYMIGVARQFSGIWAIATGGLGIIASFACSAVGVFPVYNHWLMMAGHLAAAGCFFFTVFWTIITASIMIYKNTQGLPKSIALLALPLFGVFAAGITINPFTDFYPHIDDAQHMIINRPEHWNVAIFEWAVVLSIVGYIAATAAYFEFRRIKLRSCDGSA